MTDDPSLRRGGPGHPGHDRSVYVIGDIHGQLERLAALMVGAKLVSERGAWIGGSAHLWFLGDFLDRGPRGVDAIDVVIRLQAEARADGGQVDSLLGNHDLLALAAVRYGGTFLVNHKRNGGDPRDLKRLTPAQIDWLAGRPAMARVTDVLLTHADTDAYLAYGRTVSQVNRAIGGLLAAPDSTRWDELLAVLSARHAFDATADRGTARLIAFLSTFSARRLIHGHTPISYVTDQSPDTVVEPLVYGGGRCVNVDGGMYLGGPGFVYRFTSPV